MNNTQHTKDFMMARLHDFLKRSTKAHLCARCGFATEYRCLACRKMFCKDCEAIGFCSRLSGDIPEAHCVMKIA